MSLSTESSPGFKDVRKMDDPDSLIASSPSLPQTLINKPPPLNRAYNRDPNI